MWPFKKPKKLESYSNGFPRDVLIQSTRILFIDDEQLPIIAELRKAGFAVDHDQTGRECEVQVSKQIYDVVLLDYSGVGLDYGKSEGLDLLKHVRRVSPRTRVIAFTSRALRASESDFYRLSHAVLKKDEGIAETLSVVEAELQKSLSKEHLFEALLKTLELSSEGDHLRIREAVEKALDAKDQGGLKAAIKKLGVGFVDKGIDAIFARLFMEDA